MNPIENQTFIKQDRFIETTTTTNKESKKSGKKNELNEIPSEEKSEKSNSQQNTSISGSNNNKLDKTKDHKQKSVIILGDSMLNMSMVGRSHGNCRKTVKYKWIISSERRLNV